MSLDLYKFYSKPEELLGYDQSKNFPWNILDLAKRGVKLSNEQVNNLASDPRYAYHYAQEVFRRPWPPGERAIAGSPTWAYWYAYAVIKRPWPPGEAAIASNPRYAYMYAKFVIGRPWPPGEAAIAGDPHWREEYEKFLKSLRGK